MQSPVPAKTHSKRLRLHLKDLDDSFVPSVSICVCVCVCVCALSCPTLCDPTNCSPPASSVYGILQSRILEWVAESLSGVSSQPKDWTQVSCISCIAGGFFTAEPAGKLISI